MNSIFFYVVYNYLKAKEKEKILPTVILLDDAQWTSADFAILLHRLLVDAEKDCWPLLVVATCWPDDLRRAEALLANQPMPKDPEELEHWIGDPLARLGVLLSAKAEKVVIGRFPATGAGSLEKVVREAFPGLNERQRNLLLQASAGSPRHLLLLIKELQESPIWFVDRDMTRALREDKEKELQELAAKRVEDLIRDQIDRAGENVKAGIAFGSHIGPTFPEEFAQRLAKKCNCVVNQEDLKQAHKPFGFVEPRSGNAQDRIFEFTYRIFHSVAQTILYREFGNEPDLNRILGQVLAEWLGQDEIWESRGPAIQRAAVELMLSRDEFHRDFPPVLLLRRIDTVLDRLWTEGRRAAVSKLIADSEPVVERAWDIVTSRQEAGDIVCELKTEGERWDWALATILMWRSYYLSELSRYTPALRVSEDAVRLFRDLQDRLGPDATPNLIMDVAVALINRGAMLSNLGNPEEAPAAYREAMSLLRPLLDASEFEATHKAREFLATALANSAPALSALTQHEEAAEAIDEAVRLLRDLQDRLGPYATPNLIMNVAAALINRGDVLNRVGNPEEALAAYREAISLLRPLLDAPEFEATHEARELLVTARKKSFLL